MEFELAGSFRKFELADSFKKFELAGSFKQFELAGSFKQFELAGSFNSHNLNPVIIRQGIVAGFTPLSNPVNTTMVAGFVPPLPSRFSPLEEHGCVWVMYV